MFTDEEITYMKSLGLNYDFNNLSKDDVVWKKIVDIVGDREVYCYNTESDDEEIPMPEGRISTEIVTKITTNEW